MIENHAARALKKSAPNLVMSKIDDPGHSKSTGLQLVDDVSPALGAAPRCKHRIQHNRGVVMERNPVSRKHGIRSIQVFLIFNDNDLDNRLAQPAGENVKLHTRAPLDFFAVDIRNFSLK